MNNQTNEATAYLVVAQAYVNDDGECEQIDWLGTLNPVIDDEFIPLFAYKGEPNTITITESEYAKLKADAERWNYFIETCSSETGFELTGIDDASNEQINEAIDQARGAK